MNQNLKNTNKKPFLKWAGSKYRILDKILPVFPKGSRFVEPFAGSCAVYLNMPTEKALVCDINKDLISLYQHIQREGEDYIQYCSDFFIDANNTKEMFLNLREKFNNETDSHLRGALLLYLNRHAFNGLVRYNSKGRYNVPFGKYKKPYFPLFEMRTFYHKTQATKTEFCVSDFRTVFSQIQPGDVVYCDPPYVPLSTTANFTSYAGISFGMQDQQDLAALAKESRRKGVPVFLSNHDTEITRRLYSNAEVINFNVQRFISCNGEERGVAPELLAMYR